MSNNTNPVKPNNNNPVKPNVMDLEKLKIQYSSQLNAYKQAVTDYINYIQQKSSQPCNSYSSNSTGISQACYNDIWKKTGCGTGNVKPDSNNSWVKSQTLNGLIKDTWYWATMTDSNHRNGCYGSNNKNYNTTTSPDYNITKPTLITIKGKTFWGTGQQSVRSGGTVEQCKALCSSTAGCSGATYKPDVNGKSMCWLRTGEGQLTPALNTDVAIIPEAQKYLLTIDSINSKLINTNQQIQTIIGQSVPVYNSMKIKGQENNNELLENYNQLLNEREKISELLDSYEVLEQTEKQGDIKVNKNYYSYFLLVIIAIGAVILLYKFLNVNANTGTNTSIQTGGELSEKTSIFLLIIIVIILVINYYTNIKTTASTTKDGLSGIISIFFSNISSFFSLSDN